METMVFFVGLQKKTLRSSVDLVLGTPDKESTMNYLFHDKMNTINLATILPKPWGPDDNKAKRE
jgi:hypothetical protein